MTTENAKRRKPKSKKVYDEMLKKAGKSFGESMKYLDELPNAPKKLSQPFPYGNSSSRPYGWFLK